MTSKTFSRFLAILLILLPVFSFLSCSSSVDSDPDAQIPTITSISGDISTVMNIAKELSVGVSVSDKGTLSYQWYVAESKIAEGTAISDATGARFTPQTQSVGIFYYYCVITNKLGSSKRSVTSPRITYTVGDSVNAIKPVIAQQPENVTTDFGEDFLLSVNAYSPDGGTLSYQWYFSSSADGKATALEGASESSYKGTVSADTIGSYYCVVTNTIEDNGDGGAKSAIARTNIVIVSNDMVNANTPVITSQPADAEAIIPAIHVFSVGAYTADEGILTYQWYSVLEGESEGTAIEGAAESKLRLTESKVGKTGYYCVITSTIEDNGDGGAKSASVTSETAWLTTVYLKDVVPAPTFTKQPPQMSVAPYNQSITLSCTAEVAGYAVRYKWYESFDGTSAAGKAVSEGSGADTATFTTPAFTEKGIRYFYCVATTVIAENEGGDVNTVATISDVVSVACTGLPTLYLDTNVATGAITRDAYVLGSMKLISEEYGDFSYTFSKAKEGVKGRGNSSWGMPKKGYNIKFDEKQSFFGRPAAKKWCIIANYSDKSLLRNKFASILGTELFNAMWNPSFFSVDVVMNGEYLGNYIFCEKITITDGRIEVQDISDCTDKKIRNGKYTDQNDDGETDLYDGGFILEIDGRYDADFYFTTTKGVPVTLKDPDEVSAEIQNHIKTVVQAAEDALYAADFGETIVDENGTAVLSKAGEEQSKWMKYLDIDSFVDWYIVQEFAKSVDAGGISVYMYYNPTDKKLHQGSNWDFDISFGNADYATGDTPTDFYVKNVNAWISRLFEDPRFVAKVQSRWNDKKSDLNNAVNSTGEFSIQSLADGISFSADYNFMKWNILGIYVWPNVAGYETRTTYQSEVDYMREWCNKRYDWLDTAINEAFYSFSSGFSSSSYAAQLKIR